MKQLIIVIALFITLGAAAQEKVTPTDHFTVEGRVKKSVTITLKDLNALKKFPIGDSVVVTNHTGQYKSTTTALQGVLIKDALAKVEFDAESPRILSEYYFTFIASDGYKVVFSWNELYNTATGDKAYVITDGAKPDQQISIIVPTDFKTGRRYLKALQTIKVSRVP
jgi:hypothetical protein